MVERLLAVATLVLLSPLRMHQPQVFPQNILIGQSGHLGQTIFTVHLGAAGMVLDVREGPQASSTLLTEGSPWLFNNLGSLRDIGFPLQGLVSSRFIIIDERLQMEADDVAFLPEDHLSGLGIILYSDTGIERTRR